MKNRRCLSGQTLKLLAAFAMLIDHIAWAFVPTATAAGHAMHLLGRVTAPIMCFFLVEGYYHTRSFSRYAVRLFLFACLSQIPFAWYESGPAFPAHLFDLFNMIYTLFICLLALWIQDHVPSPIVRFCAVSFLCCFSILGDWSFFAVFFVLIFARFRNEFSKQALGLCAITALMLLYMGMPCLLAYQAGRENGWELLIKYLLQNAFQLGILLSLLPLSLYNGRRGGNGAWWEKWFFYLFYPIHLVLIGVIRWQ